MSFKNEYTVGVAWIIAYFITVVFNTIIPTAIIAALIVIAIIMALTPIVVISILKGFHKTVEKIRANYKSIGVCVLCLIIAVITYPFVKNMDNEIVIEDIIQFVITIFSLGFPLMFQTASRIDDKYDSTLLIKMFRKDPFCVLFIRTLLFTLLCAILWMLKIPFKMDLGENFNAVLSNSALILLVNSTMCLIIITMCTMWLMYVYFEPELLFKRLEKQYSNTNNKEEYFEAISKILFYSIKKEGEPLARQLQQFYHKEFVSYRKGKENEVIEYPDYFYNVMFDFNECLCQRNRKSISLYNNSVYELFIDEFQHTIISEKTFLFIWKCIKQSVFYQKQEFVFSYWRKAHQYFNFWLNPIPPIYDNFRVTNQSDIERRCAERERFLEFNYALGGLLMMKGEYKLINQLTTWTNQIPPKYVLVPETMKEVIIRFMKVEQTSRFSSFYYEQRYPFPDVSGVEANDIIKMWIKRYIAILFLRQYTLRENFIYSHTLETPNPPKKLSEKKEWIKELDTLNSFVSEYLSNTDCLRSLNMETLSASNWFQDNNKPIPQDLIKKLKDEVNYSAEEAKQNQSLDKDKINQFNEATKKILSNSFDGYTKLFPNIISNNTPHKSLYFGGRYDVFDKMAFAEDQDIGYVNFDSITASVIVSELRHNFPSIFRIYYKTDYYLFAEKDIWTVIDSLHLNCHEYTIISVGINLHSHEIQGLETEKQDSLEYKQIPIIKLSGTQIDVVNHSLFIMKNEDLPCILHNEIDETIKNKYGLKQIDKTYHIYANVVDLNSDESIQEEVKEDTKIQDLSKSVLVCIDVNTEVRCRIKAKCIQLQVFSQFDNIGNPSKVDDVKNIWNN